MDDLNMRIVALQRLLNEILTRLVALENRIAAQEQGNSGRWYQTR
jgi:hypothetical protein